MTNSLPIKTILIGVGSMGQNHLRTINQNTNFELVAIVDKQYAQDKQPTQDKPSETRPSIVTTGNIKDLDSLDYQCAFIATPTSTHFALAKELLIKGKHLFIEKPVTTTYEEGCELDALAKEKNLTIRVGHIERCNPVVRKLKNVIEGGWIGQPIHFTTTRVGGCPKEINDGNNVLLDLAVHDLDILATMIGSLNIHSSICHSSLRKGVYDTAEIVVTNESGVSGSVHVNWITPTKIRTIRVTGTKGVCTADYIKQTCTLYGGDLLTDVNPDNFNFEQLRMAYQNSDRVNFGIIKKEPLKIQLQEFWRALQGEPNILATCKEASAIVKLTTEAIESSWKGHIES